MQASGTQETKFSNALALYTSLGFVVEKRPHRFYLNDKDTCSASYSTSPLRRTPRAHRTSSSALAPPSFSVPAPGPSGTTPMSVVSEYGSSTLCADTPAGIVDASGAALVAHLSAGAGFRGASPERGARG